MSVSLTLHKIYCVVTSEPGNDELFFTSQIDGGDQIRFPAGDGNYHSISAGGSWVVDQHFTFNSSLVITLWDEDNWPSTSDYLGQETYTPENLPLEATVSGTGAQYQLYIVKR